jgi:hypothetical protein
MFRLVTYGVVLCPLPVALLALDLAALGIFLYAALLLVHTGSLVFASFEVDGSSITVRNAVWSRHFDKRSVGLSTTHLVVFSELLILKVQPERGRGAAIWAAFSLSPKRRRAISHSIPLSQDRTIFGYTE